MTSAKLVFFTLLQVIVFEEQETDGKIQFTTSPDYGMTVDVQWRQEMRQGWQGEEDDEGVAGEEATEAIDVSFVYPGTDAPLRPAEVTRVSERDILCPIRRRRRNSDPDHFFIRWLYFWHIF